MTVVALPGVQAQAPRPRSPRDVVRPVPRLVLVAIVLAGVALSAAGWLLYGHVRAAEEAAGAAAVQTRITVWERDTIGNEANALSALVVHRCDTGQIRDRQVCDAARALR